MIKLLRYPDLVERRVVKNRMTLSRLIKHEGFPPGFLLSANARVWREEDVDAWIEMRASGVSANKPSHLSVMETTEAVRALPPSKARYSVRCRGLRGFYVRVTPNGTRTYVAVCRDAAGQQIWSTIGDADLITLEDAQQATRSVIMRIKAGRSVELESAPINTWPV